MSQDFMDDVTAAIADAGLPVPPEAELMRAVGHAVLMGLPPEHTAVCHMGEDELVVLGERLSAALRQAGLKGPALDEALAACFREAIRAIDRERDTAAKRHAAIKVVVP